MRKKITSNLVAFIVTSLFTVILTDTISKLIPGFNIKYLLIAWLTVLATSFIYSFSLRGINHLLGGKNHE